MKYVTTTQVDIAVHPKTGSMQSIFKRNVGNKLPVCDVQYTGHNIQRGTKPIKTSKDGLHYFGI